MIESKKKAAENTDNKLRKGKEKGRQGGSWYRKKKNRSIETEIYFTCHPLSLPQLGLLELFHHALIL